MPPDAEWFAYIDNPQTRWAYQNDLREFMSFVGISAAREFRAITRAHVIAWRQDLEGWQLAGSTVCSGDVRGGPSEQGLVLVVKTWAKHIGIGVERISPHALRAMR